MENIKKVMCFRHYKSWETWITHLCLMTQVPVEDFKILMNQFGLFKHRYDEEMEERFNWWAIRTSYFNDEDGRDFTKWDKTEKIVAEMRKVFSDRGYDVWILHPLCEYD